MLHCHLLKKSAVIIFSVATLCVASSCGKKSAQAPPPAPAAEQPANATDAGGSTPAVAVAPSQPQPSFQQVQAAMRNRDYQQAVAAMLAYQRTVKPTTPEQSARYVQQMRELQLGLAGAVAGGDPNAKAAADALRAAAAHH